MAAAVETIGSRVLELQTTAATAALKAKTVLPLAVKKVKITVRMVLVPWKMK